MDEIKIDVSGLKAILRSAPEIVCNNAGYVIHFYTDASWDSREPLYAALTINRNGSVAHSRVPVVSGIAALPTLSGEAYSIDIGLYYSDDVQTDKVWFSCEESIKTYPATEYNAGFDVYNKICGMLRRGISSTEYQATLAELQADYTQPVVPTEAEYIAAVTDRHRASYITGTVTLRDSTIIDLDDADIAEHSVTITTNALTEDALLPGGTPSAELRIALNTDLAEEDMYGAEIELTVWQEISPVAFYPVPLGAYRVTGASDASEVGVTLTAYDDMDKLNSIPLSALEFDEDVLYAPQEIVETIADKAGINYDEDISTGYANERTDSVLLQAFGVQGAAVWMPLTITNVDSITNIQAALDARYGAGALTYRGDVKYRKDLPDGHDVTINSVYKCWYNGSSFSPARIKTGVETARDLLSCVCQIVCAFAYIGHDRKLHIRSLAARQPIRSYTGDQLLKTDISRQPYKLFLLRAELEEIDPETGFKLTTIDALRTDWPDGVTVRSKSNPLLATVDMLGRTTDQHRVTSNVRNVLGPVDFYPFQADIYDDAALELGDWVAFGERKAPITGYQWHYHGQSRIECRGAETIAGELRSQADKETSALKDTIYYDAKDAYRKTNLTLIKTYRGLRDYKFKYGALKYYEYKDFIP